MEVCYIVGRYNAAVGMGVYFYFATVLTDSRANLVVYEKKICPLLTLGKLATQVGDTVSLSMTRCKAMIYFRDLNLGQVERLLSANRRNVYQDSAYAIVHS